MVDDQADALARFPGLATPLVEDLLLRVSADGEVLQEISILEVLFASRYRACVGQRASPVAATGATRCVLKTAQIAHAIWCG